MKKIMSVLVVLALIASGMVIAAFATDDAVIAVEKATANSGREVTVAVMITNNPGFAAAKITVTYDAEALTLVGVDTKDCLLAGATENDTKGIVAFASATNVTGDGKLFTITFQVNEGVDSGDYAVSVTVGKLINSDREAVAHAIEAGAITVAAACNHENTLVHVDAVAPTCKQEGNIEYWHCSACGLVWKDAALTQLIDLKNVSLPTANHVDADKNGTCDTCGESVPTPNVGDSIYLVVAAALIAAIGIVVLTKKRAS